MHVGIRGGGRVSILLGPWPLLAVRGLVGLVSITYPFGPLAVDEFLGSRHLSPAVTS